MPRYPSTLMLSPAEIYPAGVAEVTTRMIGLSTGIRVRVAESGHPDGPPVSCCTDGARRCTCSVTRWRCSPNAASARSPSIFAAMGCPIILPRRSRIRSTPISGDLDALLDSLGIEGAVLVGQSMGGGVALHYTLRHPARVRRLVLINPVGLVSIGWVTLMRVIPQMLMDRLGRWVLPRWLTRFILRHIAYGDGSLVSERDVDENWSPTQLPGSCMRSARDR